MPRETFSHTARVPVPPEDLWPALDAPATWEGITGIDRVLDPIVDEQGRLAGFSFETRIGSVGYRGTAIPRERVEGSAITWDIDGGEIRGVTAVGLTTDGDGTLVGVTLEVESVGMMSTLFFPMIANAIRNGLPHAVEEFARGLGDQP